MDLEDTFFSIFFPNFLAELYHLENSIFKNVKSK